MAVKKVARKKTPSVKIKKSVPLTRSARRKAARKENALRFLMDKPSIPRKKNPHEKQDGALSRPRAKPKGRNVGKKRQRIKTKGTSNINTP